MLLNVARAALDERGFHYELIADDTLLRFRVQGRSAAYHCSIRTDEEWEQAVLLVGSTVLVPERARLRACELFTRANFGLRIGCFELDVDDGEWRYRVSVDVEGGALTPRMVNVMLSAALVAMDDHHDAVMRVSYGDLSAAQAYAEAEAARQERALAAQRRAAEDGTPGEPSPS
jgi:hypothetical protein